ncbi:hypothetical protein JCM11251_005874 [Rhodosporidiobolus azoricus]
MASEDDTDDFFIHRQPAQKTASTRQPTRKRRKSSHDSDAAASESSSDLEVLSSPKKKSANRGKATVKGEERAPASKPLKKSANKTKRPTKEVLLSSSETDEAEGGPSSTQMDEGTDALLQLARRAGNKAVTPERRRKHREEKAAEQQREQRQRLRNDPYADAVLRDSDEDSSSSRDRTRRRTSASTAQTTVSDRSSSATKAKASTSTGKKIAAPKSKSTKTTSRKKRVPSPPSRSPSPVEQPPEPEAFWGADPVAARASAAKRQHGVASKQLATLSERQPDILLDDDGEDDIAGSSDSGSDRAPKKYESVQAKAKREKAEAMARMKAKRNGAKLPLQQAPNGVTSMGSPRRNDKGKGKEVDRSGQCDVCGQKVFNLQAHHADCFNFAALDDIESQLDCAPRAAADPFAGPPRPPSSRKAATATSTSNAFRPAGAAPSKPPPLGAPRAPPQRTVVVAGPPPVDLAAQLFPSSSPRATRKNPPVAATRKTRGRGSAATLVEDTEEEREEEGFPLRAGACGGGARGKGAAPPREEDEFDGYLDSNDPEFDEQLAAWNTQAGGIGAVGEAVRGGGSGGGDEEEWEDPADFAMLDRTVIDLANEADDDDEISISGPARFKGKGKGKERAGRNDGSFGAVNKERRPGPPADGSSPPRGSIYVSTMSTAVRQGYEHLYARPDRSSKSGASTSNGGDGGLDFEPDDEAGAFDAAFSVPKPSGRGARGGRGGARKSSWGWGRGRGRGARGRGRARKS